jgi:hypothetical protein
MFLRQQEDATMNRVFFVVCAEMLQTGRVSVQSRWVDWDSSEEKSRPVAVTEWSTVEKSHSVFVTEG